MNEDIKKALNRITKQAIKIKRTKLTYIDDLYCNIVTKKVKCIMANSSHSLHHYYARMITGRGSRGIATPPRHVRTPYYWRHKYIFYKYIIVVNM